jgi:glutamyl-tRNA synthetase
MKQAVRVRFAPSPTGQLHIGNFRTALFNWLFARHYKGTFLLRIEDTDPERSKQEYTDSIMKTLSWVGIEADEEVVVQSERLAEYKEMLDLLIQENKAYRCYCTQDEIKVRLGNDLFIKYDEKCRDRTDHPDAPHAIRFRLPDVKHVAFDDMIRGRISVDRDQLDDFILARSDGWPTYNFVVVVDDHYMNITDIIRGEDHIPNTPKQVLLYEAFGFKIPRFAHLPLILGPSGDRLSKRDAATSVLEYRQEGYLPGAVVNYLARLGWAHGDQEVFTADQLIEFFTLEAVGKKASIFDLTKFQWLNSVYIKNMSASEIIDYIQAEIDNNFRSLFPAWNDQQLINAVDLYKERVSILKQLIEELHILYNGPAQYDPADYSKWITADTVHHLERILLVFEQKGIESSCFEMLKKLAEELQVKIVQVMQPLRLALIGKSSGPGVCELIQVIGIHQSSERIRALIRHIQRAS